jgi:hypothetical protein
MLGSRPTSFIIWVLLIIFWKKKKKIMARFHLAQEGLIVGLGISMLFMWVYSST